MESVRGATIRGITIRWPRIRVEERLTILFFICAAILSASFGTSVFSGLNDYLFFYFAMLVPMFAGLCAIGAMILKKMGRLDQAETNPFTKDFIGFFIRSLLTLVVGFFAYSHLKVLIPLVNISNFDPLFFELDRLLFFGYSPTRLLLEIKVWWFSEVMFFSYASFYVAFCLMVALAFLKKDVQMLRQLVLGILVIYIIGMALYYLFPSIGPLFVSPDLYAHTTNKYQGVLWGGHLAIQANPATFQAGPYLGVAAFPSLHGAHFLFLMLMAYRYTRPLAWIYVPWICLLYLSTIYLGWHYVVDLVAGAGMAYITYWAVQRLIPE